MTPSTEQQKRRSVALVLGFTVVSATAQVLIKSGANRLGLHPNVLSVATNLYLLTAFSLYGIGTAMMILALRHGELSLLWPMISLSYPLVAILSVVVFHETLNPLRIAGIMVIMTGVGVLGRGRRP